ncbi:calcium-binding protein E63-1-like [Tropilaelaps mercedesae]|uniref:Calcium-binding protein E63-1-like n=1 Tax=Tropilaelaps mercedesae TaxID=418985 RepID=A0A1V9X3Q6_9ACAR|nr:calcium-binding protein E63-1-like [Tropilaelaps mercedesae]
MCETTVALRRPVRRSSVQVEMQRTEKTCLTICQPDDDDDVSPPATSSSSRSKEKEKQPETTGRLQRLKELHTAFNMLDANHDGRVSLDELQDMLRRMGFNIPREGLDLLLQDKTTSPAGQVSLSEFEFLQWIEDVLSKDATQSGTEDVDQDMIAAFKTPLCHSDNQIFDTDGDGFITRAELRGAMDTIGEKLTEEELDEILQHTDVDRDGRIDYQGGAITLHGMSLRMGPCVKAMPLSAAALKRIVRSPNRRSLLHRRRQNRIATPRGIFVTFGLKTRPAIYDGDTGPCRRHIKNRAARNK